MDKENGAGKCDTHIRAENVMKQLKEFVGDRDPEGGDKNVYAAQIGLRLLGTIFSNDPEKRALTLSRQRGEVKELVTVDASRQMLSIEGKING